MITPSQTSLKEEFNKLYVQLVKKQFIEQDPISIPYKYKSLQDREISGFFAAIFAWGRRDIIISKANDLMQLMGEMPYDFIQNYKPVDYKKIVNFKHRTFNADDLDFYIRALRKHYQKYSSMEYAFITSGNDINASQDTIEPYLKHFYQYFSSLVPFEQRNLKHISTPHKNSACKRLCMYLRWMVRGDEIDFGIWKSIQPSQLIIPLDIHVMRVAQRFKLLSIQDKPDWKTAVKLTEKLKSFDKEDPVKYDLVLFNLGVKSLSL